MGTYVVTGAAGYIGGVLAKKLKTLGHKVITIDTKHTKPLYTDEHWASSCFSKELFVKRIIDEKVDAIFHLAAHSLLGPSAYDPIPYFVNNAGKTAEFLDRLIKAGWKGKFVFSSTAAVYGERSSMVNEDSLKAPINYYGLSKLHAEDIIQAASDTHGLRAVIFRFFNVTGADGDVGQDINEPHILTQMSKAAYDNVPFKIYGNDYNTLDGTCVRDYIHVNDIVASHILALDYLDANEGCHKFNLGTSSGISNAQLVKAFDELIDAPLSYEYTEKRIGDPAYLVAESSRFRIATGYTFPYSNLTNIITTHWEHYKNARNQLQTVGTKRAQ